MDSILVAFKIRLCNHKYAIFSFKPVLRPSMTHTNRKETCTFTALLEWRCSILAISRTQVNSLMYSNTLYYIYFMCVINTDSKRKVMQTGCEQSTKSLKDDPLNSSYFTSQMNILLNNTRKYCVYTFFLIPGSGWVFRRRSNCFRSILSMLCISDQYLLTLVAFHGEIKIFGEPRVLPSELFMMMEALNKLNDSAPTFLGQMQTGFKWWAISEYARGHIIYICRNALKNEVYKNTLIHVEPTKVPQP